MSDFDPYHIWLGIPETERPISKYRLLGIGDFEDNRDVISTAAERQTVFLRTLQAGEHAVLVADLLNEVSQARVTLLNADQKAEYDEELRKQQTPEPEPAAAPPPISVVQTTEPPPTPVVVRGTVTQDFPVSVVQPVKRPRRRRQQEIWKQPVVIGVSVVGVIGVFVLVISLMSSANTLPASLQEGLVAYYPFNGNANDESGNGNHGEVQGAIFAPDRLATPEKSIAFNNKGQAVVVRANNDLNSIPSDTHSVCFWIRPSIDAIDKSRFAYLINRVKPGNIQWNYLWECSPDKSKPTGRVRASTNSVHVPGNQPADFSVGFDRWNHVVFSTDASSTRVFIAGKIRGSYNPLVWPSIPSIDLRFGNNYVGDQFIGSLDDIRIYNRALSAAEVKALYEYESKPPALPISTVPAIESITNTIGMTLNKIPAGTFMMGSPEDEPERSDIEHQHRVTITKAFYMQTTEVTQGQWVAVMGTEPWKGKDFVKEAANCPAVYMRRDDAVAYCKKLSEKEGTTYRLPTEAEWEYACRAGTQTAWSLGDDENELGDYAWYDKNAKDIGEKYAHQVGLKKPNAFGLYDMHGNVFEWCHDYLGHDYYKQSPEKDPTGPESGSSRVLRGGCWYNHSRDSRSAYRNRNVVDGRYLSVDGFRVVRELD